MKLTIRFGQAVLDCNFDYTPPDEDVGLGECIDIYRVDYGDCDVTDIIDAGELWDELDKLVWAELEKR